MFVLGALLHINTVVFQAEGELTIAGAAFLGGLLLWSLVPYAVWAGLAILKGQPAPAVGASLATFGVDLFWYYSAFVAPQSSTAALGLLFAPMWNLVLFGPLGAAVSWPTVSLLARRESAA
ncbi:MAG: hypothetical protein R3F58_10650 [Steroidobacteraceae bacterium]